MARFSLKWDVSGTSCSTATEPVLRGNTGPSRHARRSAAQSIARDLLDDLRWADRQLAAMGKTIATEVAGSGTTLAEIHGIGSILAAKIIGHAGLVTRFGSKRRFRQLHRVGPRRGLQRRHPPPST